MMKISMPKLTVWKIVATLFITGAAIVTFRRFFYGLGETTNLSDAAPWGLWIGFDVVTGVGLAAGGFTLCGIVYLFNLKRFKPIVRPAILTAFLGYMLVIVGLMFDLGRPWAIWHAIIMWNPHSVMFEVAWCVMLYTTVLALEFSPVLLERFKLHKTLKIIKAITIPLVIAGVLLSMLHQSSLGSLYLIIPQKMHAFWYSPMLPVFFFVSAIAVGIGMTVIEAYLSSRAFKRTLETPLLYELSRIMIGVILVYATMRVLDLAEKGLFASILNGSLESNMLLLEFALFIIFPVALFTFKQIRKTRLGLFLISISVVLGFVANRLNVTTTSLDAYFGGVYFPSVEEFILTGGIITAGFWLFSLAVKHLPIFPDEHLDNEEIIIDVTSIRTVSSKPMQV
jgi:Ni/Fe-hydrogenase subunit HybB-like protein